MSTSAIPNISSNQLREDLLEIVVRDLLGPAGGPNEEIAEPRVRERYLTGMLAPRKQEVADEEFEDVTIDPGEQDELAAAGAGNAEEGTPERGATSSPTLFPCSFGLSFGVSLQAPAIQVEARWGQYLRETSQFAKKKDGSAKLVWRHYERGRVLAPITLVAGKTIDQSIDSDSPEVVLRGRVRRYQDHWSVTLFLVNNQIEPKRRRDEAWVFQPELIVTSPDGSAIFEKRSLHRSARDLDSTEAEALDMLYRKRLEFAVGHGVSIHAEPDESGTCAYSVETRVIPRQQVPQSTSPTEADFPALAGLELDMKALAETAQKDLRAKLEPLTRAYELWIQDRETEAQTADLQPHQVAAKAAIEHCRTTLDRLRDGIDLLASDSRAADAFAFANRAMHIQRVRTLMADEVRNGRTPDRAAIDVPKNRSWRVFQLAFFLINLRGLTELSHPDRIGEGSALCDLLWFPTGGGKTEAYLGLTAYTLAIRRLHGTVAGRSGEDGLAVLMRYTLRLLTLQQFERTAALICACEAIRRDALGRGDARWGQSPFRLGLWVGQKTTPNTNEQADESVKTMRGTRRGFAPRGGVGSRHQLSACPWCGSPIDPGRDIVVRKAPNDIGRTLIFCSDKTGKCLFTPAKAPDEGIPVMVVDEDIYRRLPSVMIATVDKFAQMAWNGRVGMLFGQVDSTCERHGYRCPDVDDEKRHIAGKLPAAKTLDLPPLRPPDLIIQDELHLISGPLGSLVGLYETAVDDLCSWTVEGRLVRPKVIASTATVRKAGDQVHAVFRRRVNVFPAQGLEVGNSFFAVERKPSDETPGRLYLGVCAPGRRVKVALIRVYVAMMAAAQEMWETHGVKADPWMTLVGYFNAMLELAGMRRLADDDVKSRLSRADLRGLRKRTLRIVQELTSRVSATDIRPLLDRMKATFDPKIDTVREQLRKEKKFDSLPLWPFDVILATNMISVGVDVPRLGLMVVAGQPKTTAEYIQATSRVGRSHPGIVCTVYNWARPRDLSHYESFEHYHATFYKHVEALSVTPFSSGAVARGLTALLVSEVRLRGSGFNANGAAGQVGLNEPYVEDAIDRITRRAHTVASADVAAQVKAELCDRVDDWLARAGSVSGGSVLGYQEARDGRTLGLLSKPGFGKWDQFTCLNSLRDVEPMVNLILQDAQMDAPGAVGVSVAPEVEEADEMEAIL
jgi:ribosomal protein L24E